MAFNVTRDSNFNDGMDVAARKPKQLSLGSSRERVSRVTSGRTSTSGQKRADRQAALDQRYADGYKTALLDMLYLDGSQGDPAAAMNDPMMDPSMMDPSMMGPAPQAPAFDPQVAAMMGNPGTAQAMMGG